MIGLGDENETLKPIGEYDGFSICAHIEIKDGVYVRRDAFTNASDKV